jgi:hypothetical protein
LPVAGCRLPRFRFSVIIAFLQGSVKKRCRDGGIGRRTGLKIPRPRGHGGSIPPPGTIKAFVATSDCIKLPVFKAFSLYFLFQIVF